MQGVTIYSVKCKTRDCLFFCWHPEVCVTRLNVSFHILRHMWGGRTHPCSDSARVFFHFVDK